MTAHTHKYLELDVKSLADSKWNQEELHEAPPQTSRWTQEEADTNTIYVGSARSEAIWSLNMLQCNTAETERIRLRTRISSTVRTNMCMELPKDPRVFVCFWQFDPTLKLIFFKICINCVSHALKITFHRQNSFCISQRKWLWLPVSEQDVSAVWSFASVGRISTLSKGLRTEGT